MRRLHQPVLARPNAIAVGAALVPQLAADRELLAAFGQAVARGLDPAAERSDRVFAQALDATFDVFAAPETGDVFDAAGLRRRLGEAAGAIQPKLTQLQAQPDDEQDLELMEQLCDALENLGRFLEYKGEGGL